MSTKILNQYIGAFDDETTKNVVAKDLADAAKILIEEFSDENTNLTLVKLTDKNVVIGYDDPIQFSHFTSIVESGDGNIYPTSGELVSGSTQIFTAVPSEGYRVTGMSYTDKEGNIHSTELNTLSVIVDGETVVKATMELINE